MATVRKRNQVLNGIENLDNHPVRGIRIVGRNIAAEFVNVFVSFGVKLIPLVIRHRERLRSASVFAMRRAKASSPGIIVTFPLLMSS